MQVKGRPTSIKIYCSTTGKYHEIETLSVIFHPFTCVCLLMRLTHDLRLTYDAKGNASSEQQHACLTSKRNREAA